MQTTTAPVAFPRGSQSSVALQASVRSTGRAQLWTGLALLSSGRRPR
jgi:hypothetical protein